MIYSSTLLFIDAVIGPHAFYLSCVQLREEDRVCLTKDLI